MSRRIDDVRKRIAKRQKERRQHKFNNQESYLIRDEEKYGGRPVSSYEDPSRNTEHPLFRKEILMFQILAAVSIFLIVAIMFKSPANQWGQAKHFVNQTFEREFQFAAVSTWYEDQFGKPLAFLPGDNNSQVGTTEGINETNREGFAVPAAGKILESFEVDGKGITVETGKDSKVEAVNEGVVIFVGPKEGLGKTVILQHADGSETWYGQLDEINIEKVKLYEFLDSRTALGQVSNQVDGETGTFYFAVKKGDHFIDPIQVISFD